MGLFNNLFGDKEKLKKTQKLKYDDFVFYQENELKSLSEQGIIEVIETLQPEDYVVKAWFGKYIHFIFKQYSLNGSNVVISYILDNYPTALNSSNTTNYFILNSFEFGQKELFLKYFDWIVDNISYPFYWERTIVPEALEYNAWWGINKIWERSDKTDWHPLDQTVEKTGKSIILTAVTRLYNAEDQANNINMFINKCKENKHIREKAANEFTDDERWEMFIPDEVTDIFLF